MSVLLKNSKFPPYPPCATNEEKGAPEIVEQPPQINCTNPAGGRLRTYLKTLHAVSEQHQRANEREKAADRRDREMGAQIKVIRAEPLDKQIQRWWINLPPVMQNRKFQIIEIANQCNGRFKERPALRNVAAALRALDWREYRDWTTTGRNRRFWIPSLPR
jgi:hypothetical protein